MVLQSINHDGPVVVRELGKAHKGLVWTVQPQDFDSVVEMINQFGGPAFWSIKPVAA